jgi:hypothetical protein
MAFCVCKNRDCYSATSGELSLQFPVAPVCTKYPRQVRGCGSAGEGGSRVFEVIRCCGLPMKRLTDRPDFRIVTFG